jgi:hypothetical protein
VHPRIQPTSRVPSPFHAPDEPVIGPPDAGGDSDLVPLDTGWDPAQQDNFGDNSQAAGPHDASPLSGPSDTSEHLGPPDASQLPDADYMGPPEDFEPASLTIDDEAEDMVTSLRLPKLKMTQAFIDLLQTTSLEDAGLGPEDIRPYATLSLQLTS